MYAYIPDTAFPLALAQRLGSRLSLSLFCISSLVGRESNRNSLDPIAQLRMGFDSTSSRVLLSSSLLTLISEKPTLKTHNRVSLNLIIRQCMNSRRSLAVAVALLLSMVELNISIACSGPEGSSRSEAAKVSPAKHSWNLFSRTLASAEASAAFGNITQTDRISSYDFEFTPHVLIKDISSGFSTIISSGKRMMRSVTELGALDNPPLKVGM